LHCDREGWREGVHVDLQLCCGNKAGVEGSCCPRQYLRDTPRRLDPAEQPTKQTHLHTALPQFLCHQVRQGLRSFVTLGGIAAGNFRHRPAKFRKLATPEPSTHEETATFSGGCLAGSMAQVLPLGVASSNVFQAALLLIVLTLAAGQDAALLCGVWCHSGGGMAGACEQQTEPTSPIITNDDCTISGNAIVFVREDARRSTSAPTVQNGALVPQFAFTSPASGSLSGYEEAGRQLLESRPLVLALRI